MDLTLHALAGRPPSVSFAETRRQETALILLNLGTLVALLALHAAFRPLIGAPGPLVLGLFATRFVTQLGELGWLHRPGTTLSARGTWWYARLTILANLGFAVLASWLGRGPDSHYVVLMAIPVLAAAWRLSLAGLVVVVATAATLTWLQVWVPDGSPAWSTRIEQFEATTVALVFVVVAAVVRLLAVQVWSREAALGRTVEDLVATRRRLVEEEKLSAVGRLAGAIAHEVRNPVTMMASAIAAARRPGADASLRGELGGILEKETRRLQRLTEDLLTYARPAVPTRRRTRLATAVGAAVGLARARAEELGVTLEFVVPPEAEASFDPFQVQQALLNLVGNALDATPRGGRILVEARVEGAEAVFAVEDTGAPFPVEVVARLAEPFVTTKPSGTGLGLAITRGLARAHGGDLRLVANGPGCVRVEVRVRSEPR